MSAYASQGSFLFLPPSASSVESPVKESHGRYGSPIHKSKSDSTLQNSSVSPTYDENDNDNWYSKSCLLLSIKSATIDPIRLIQFIGARKGKATIEEGRQNTTAPNSGLRHRLDVLSNSLPIGGANICENSLTTDCDEIWGEYDERPSVSPTRKPRSHYFNPPSSDISSSASPVHETDGYPNKRNIGTHASDTSIDDDATTCHASLYDGDGGPITPPSPQRSKLVTGKSSTTKNQDEGALQFKIGVNINGRKYTATRALPSFVKLRQDLMQEMSTDKMDTWQHVHNHQDTDLLIIPNLPIGNDPSYSSSESILDHLEGRARAVVGFAGRGFSRLQAALCSYCPEMEKWLRAVVMIVPASPSLANFLWEPVEGDARMKDCVLNRRQSQSSGDGGGGGSLMKHPVRRLSGRSHKSLSMSNLNSITESDCEESDWDSDGKSTS